MCYRNIEKERKEEKKENDDECIKTYRFFGVSTPHDETKI